MRAAPGSADLAKGNKEPNVGTVPECPLGSHGRGPAHPNPPFLRVVL